MKIIVFGLPQKKCGEFGDPNNTFHSRGFGEEINYVEGDFFEHIAAHYVIPAIVEAEKEGFDAALIGCFLDPGIHAARELVKMPVVGAGEASLHLAATLGPGKFSVLVGKRKWIPGFQRNARHYGLESRIASWPVFDLSLKNILCQGDGTYPALLAAAQKAVRDDNAETLCLGCTALSDHAKRLQAELGVPVLDPALVAIKTAEFRAQLWKQFGLSHSKAGGYETPPLEDLSNAYNASYSLARKVLYHFKNNVT